MAGTLSDGARHCAKIFQNLKPYNSRFFAQIAANSRIFAPVGKRAENVRVCGGFDGFARKTRELQKKKARPIGRAL